MDLFALSHWVSCSQFHFYVPEFLISLLVICADMSIKEVF